MNCDRIKEQLPECLAGKLDKTARETVIEHLETCSGCRAELAQLGVVWRALEGLAAPEIAPAQETSLRERFAERLAAFEAGLVQGRAEAAARQAAQRPVRESAPAWWSGLWARPAWQFAAALGLVAVGIMAGRYIAGPARDSAPSPDVAQLKGQVESLRQLVSLSLLQQQSPSARLEGVNYAYQMAQPDAQVEQALLHAVNQDPNVNVRLSAVDALQKYAGDPNVRRALADAVPVQDSPLVQVALIDLLVQLKDRNSAPALQALAHNAQADEAVRQRATWAIQRLGLPPAEEKQ
ncbi:MAG TPA: zf-HC2 domain-containing protein [Bryobacteraceae bacterium]|nr:zf-HC2 domain-containing protein [Bryobacteraceae bacterium]